MQSYVALTGIRRFEILAENPQDAIARLKKLIEARRHSRKDPQIGMSLLEALLQNKLNFLVFEAAGETVLEGEYRGLHQEIPDPQLINAFQQMLSPNALYEITQDLEQRRSSSQSINRCIPQEI